MPRRHRGKLGKVYADGEAVVTQGDVGAQMFVIQSGTVEVVRSSGNGESRVAELTNGDFFGEMSLFDGEVRAATVRAVGETRILSIDKRSLLKRISEDPLLAVNLIKSLSQKLRAANERLHERDAS